MSRAAILVVEDDHDTRVLMRSTLEGAGYEVHTAANGREALVILRGLPTLPQLMLVDLRMPVMDGWQLLAEVQGDTRLRPIRVGVQTASMETTLPEGVSFVLPKPVDVDALLAFAKHHCR
jgi:CheY-like chemotaxis protein